jgi:hypothetical protein
MSTFYKCDHSLVAACMSFPWLSRTNRTTLARDNPCFFATMVNDIPDSLSLTNATWSTSSGVRPIRRPSSLALLIPARTLSTQLQMSENRAKIIFLTIYESLDYLDAAFSAGASGYVNKGCLYTDLIPAIHEAMLGPSSALKMDYLRRAKRYLEE